MVLQKYKKNIISNIFAKKNLQPKKTDGDPKTKLLRGVIFTSF